MTKVKNVVYNWMGMAGSMIYAFFMSPFIIHSLGNKYYGLWNLVAACVGYMTMLDFGIQLAVNKYLAKYKGLNDLDGVNRIYSNAIAVYSLIGLLAAIFGVIIAINVENIFNIPEIDINVVRKVMIILSFYTAIGFPLTVYSSVIYAYQRFDYLNIIRIFDTCVRAVTVWYVLSHNSGLLPFCIAHVSVSLFNGFLMFVSSRSVVKRLRFHFTLLSMETIKMMFKYSVVAFFAGLVAYLIFKTDNIVIGIFLDPTAITIYAIGFMLSEHVFQIVSRMCNTLTPVFSEQEARGEHDEIKSLLITASRFSILVGIPIGLVAIVVGKDFINLWLGKGYETAYTVMVVLMCCRMIAFPLSPMHSMLYGIGKHHIVLFTGIFEAVANLGLSLVLVKKMGIIGVAWGTFIPMVLNSLVFPFIVCRTINLKVTSWLKKAVMRSFIFCFCFYILILFCSRCIPSDSWIGLLAQIALMGLTYVILLIVIGLRNREREFLIQKPLSKLSLVLSKLFSC